MDHSDVVGASPVGAAPTTSSFSTECLASMDWCKDNCKTRQETFKFWDLVHLILEVWRYSVHTMSMACLWMTWASVFLGYQGGHFKNMYELLNLKALRNSMLYKNHIFHCVGKIFCVEFQRVPLKFHTKYLTHTLKDVYFIHRWRFKSS